MSELRETNGHDLKQGQSAILCTVFQLRSAAWMPAVLV